MKTGNVILEKSRAFALRILKLSQYLVREKKEYVLSKQILRSGTSIGANVMEALQGQTRADFAFKMNIALKEANETSYWLNLLSGGGYLTRPQFLSLHSDCVELLKILTAIVKSSHRLPH